MTVLKWNLAHFKNCFQQWNWIWPLQIGISQQKIIWKPWNYCCCIPHDPISSSGYKFWTKFSFASPHIFVELDVKNVDKMELLEKMKLRNEANPLANSTKVILNEAYLSFMKMILVFEYLLPRMAGGSIFQEAFWFSTQLFLTEAKSI